MTVLTISTNESLTDEQEAKILDVIEEAKFDQIGGIQKISYSGESSTGYGYTINIDAPIEDLTDVIRELKTYSFVKSIYHDNKILGGSRHRKKCKKGSRRNPKTKKCRKTCKKGSRRNPKTHHCRKVK